jgi:hypothetical protein
MVDRTRILKALEDMPDEAFVWFVLAAAPAALVRGANIQIWPDGTEGFSTQARGAIARLREAGDEYIAAAKGLL